MPGDPPAPKPLEIEWLSPSLANDLVDCPYRVAFRLDHQFSKLRRPSTFSLLGLIAHGVVEDIALERHSPNDPSMRTTAEQRWDHRATLAEAELTAAWAPTAVPRKEQWPGYQLTKARVLRRAAEAVRVGTFARTSTRSVIEQPLEDPRSMLRGRPDRIEGPHTARRVVDLKSGLHQAEPNARQLNQLMFYGHLVEASSSDRVESLVIENASGKRWEQQYDRVASDDLVTYIVSARTAYNNAVGQDNLSQIAKPSSETCYWCPYKVVCSSYWDALEISWEHPSARGVVLREQANELGSVIQVELESPGDARGSSWTISRVPHHPPWINHTIAVADAEHTGSERHLRWKYSTMSWPSTTSDERL